MEMDCTIVHMVELEITEGMETMVGLEGKNKILNNFEEIII